MKNQLPIPLLVMSSLSAVCITAPMLGQGGVIAGLIASAFLIPLMFHYVFQGLGNGRQQTHVHYHYEGQSQQPQAYSEGHEKAVMLPNGVQMRERIVKRYNQ